MKIARLVPVLMIVWALNSSAFGAQNTGDIAMAGKSEGVVIGSPTFPIRNGVDNAILLKLQDEKIEPSGICTDEEFIRRAYLDVCGSVPPVAETKTFLADRTPDKRVKLIDTLLASERYGDHWSVVWSDLLREHSNSKPKEGTERGSYRDWVQEALVKNMPYDEFARELITASGAAEENPAANFYLRDEMDRVETANTISTVFMGTRMACAQCHDHPFDKWTQQDFHGVMAFLNRTVVAPDPVLTLLRLEKVKILSEKSREVLDPYFKEAHEMKVKEKALAEKNKLATDLGGGGGGSMMAMGSNMEAMAGAMGMLGKGREFLKDIEQKLPQEDQKRVKGLLLNGAVRQVGERPNGEYFMPVEGDGQNKKGKRNNGDHVSAVFPWDHKLKTAGPGSRRAKLAEFVTSNRQFAAVQVNRLWAQVFGKGIVDPPDDFREKNPPSNPELLSYLTDEMINSKFDTKHVLRLILNSSTYQRSSLPNASNREDTTLFSHHRVRRMTSEQVFDSILVATGRTHGLEENSPLVSRDAMGDKVKRALLGQKNPDPIEWAVDLPTPAKTGSFMNTFNQPDRESTVVKRDDAGSIAQALELLNGEAMNRALRSSPAIKAAVDSKLAARQIVDDAYLAVLARKPTNLEVSALTGKLGAQKTVKEWIEDVYWALLNTREFSFVK